MWRSSLFQFTFVFNLWALETLNYHVVKTLWFLWMQIAEVLYPTADYVTVDLNRIQGLEAREVIVRTLSTQGESQDSPVAPIPNNLLGSPRLSHRTTAAPHPMTHPVPQPHPVHSQVHPPYPSTYPPNHPQPHVQPLPRVQPHTLPHSQPHSLPVRHPPPQPHFPHHSMPKPKSSLSAREPETKEHEVGMRTPPPWERSPSPLPPMCGSNLEPPHFPPRRSPSPQRILPQPQGVPIPNTIAKAMAREAAQRAFAEANRVRFEVDPCDIASTFHGCWCFSAILDHFFLPLCVHCPDWLLTFVNIFLHT